MLVLAGSDVLGESKLMFKMLNLRCNHHISAFAVCFLAFIYHGEV